MPKLCEIHFIQIERGGRCAKDKMDMEFWLWFLSLFD